MNMIPDKMRKIGASTFHQLSWTDQEILDNICALELVIAYLRGRGDAKIIIYPLRNDLEMFHGLKECRGI